MNEQPAPALLDEERPSARDVWELARLPALFAVLTAAITWLIWYYTNTPCTPELAARTDCNPAEIAKYINVDVFGRIVTYSAITAAAGGVWNYNMFTRMRAQIAAEKQRADAAVQQLTEQRWQVEEERRQVEEQRRQERESLMAALAEERRRSDEARQQMQRQAAENQQAFMAALSEITGQMAQLMQQRSGNGGSVADGD